MEDAGWYYVPIFLGSRLSPVHCIRLLHPGLENALCRHFRFLCYSLGSHSVSFLELIKTIINIENCVLIIINDLY